MSTKMLTQVCFVACFVSLALSEPNTYTTSGASGDDCGDIKCLHDIGMCVTDGLGNQTCECNPDYKVQVLGDGALACYKRNKRYSTIRGEPIVSTYDAVNYRLNLPCRVLATKFISRLKTTPGRPDHVGTCECEVHTWQKKHKGKFYPHGFDMACLLRRTDTDPHNVTGFSVRKYGVASNGVYTFYQEGVNQFLPNGPWSDESVYVNANNIVTECKYDNENNMAFVDQINCGARVDFRPFDTQKGRHQTQPNGIAFSVNCANHPDMRDNDRTMMTGPSDHQGGDFEEYIAEYPHLNGEEVFLLRALTSDVEQNHPGYSEECNALSDSALMCTDNPTAQRRAMDQCKWMLHSQPFIKCVDTSDNAHTLLKLVRRCFDQACGAPLVTCHTFRNHLFQIPPKCSTPSMLNKVKKLNTWLNTEEFCTPP